MTQENYSIRPLSEAELLSIYTKIAPKHFPAGELRPLENIKYLLSQKGYEGLGIFKSEENAAPFKGMHSPDTPATASAPATESTLSSLLGYALFLHVPGADTVLLDFYAILEEYRSLGLGSIFLQGMKEHYRELAGLLLETEDLAFARTEAEVTERTRRNAFYFRNGAQETGVFCTLFQVPFQILFIPINAAALAAQLSGSASALEQTSAKAAQKAALFKEKLDSIYHFMLTEERYKEGVRWR